MRSPSSLPALCLVLALSIPRATRAFLPTAPTTAVRLGASHAAFTRSKPQQCTLASRSGAGLRMGLFDFLTNKRDDSPPPAGGGGFFGGGKGAVAKLPRSYDEIHAQVPCLPSPVVGIRRVDWGSDGAQIHVAELLLPSAKSTFCWRWRSNPSGKCSQERLTRGTVTSTMRRAAHPSGCARCGAGAG